MVGSIAAPLGHAQPQTDVALDRAKDLYRSAEAAMKEGRFEDALRDYGAAYDLSKDPALFFKIGHANELAGRCEVALSYYARYLREGKPTEAFVALTEQRIAACGGQRGSGAPAEPRPEPGGGSGAPGPAAGSG
ncbi:MAG TPA: hypothetical protein VFT22_30020, partial [Kofleriaceae bacterium]|nr:hypothetical protein [Kofleriaceae bacterium]